MTDTEDVQPNFEDPADDPRIEKLKAIVKILEDSSLSSLEYEDEDVDIRLSKHSLE
ncbi:MAG: hypothetical protein AAF449_18175 [Myxococcota bacterium]